MGFGRFAVSTLSFVSFLAAIFLFIGGNWLLGIVVAVVFVLLLALGGAQTAAARREIEEFEQSLSDPGPHMIQFIASVHLARSALEDQRYIATLDAISQAVHLSAQGLDLGGKRGDLEFALIYALFLAGRRAEGLDELEFLHTYVDSVVGDKWRHEVLEALTAIPTLSRAEQHQALKRVLVKMGG